MKGGYAAAVPRPAAEGARKSPQRFLHRAHTSVSPGPHLLVTFPVASSLVLRRHLLFPSGRGWKGRWVESVADGGPELCKDSRPRLLEDRRGSQLPDGAQLAGGLETVG